MTELSTSISPRSVFIRRVGAYLLDIMLLFVVLGPLGFAAQQLIAWTPVTGPEIWHTLLLNFSLPVWLYFIVCESSPRGATIGKRLVGLRVQRTDAAKPGRLQIVLRTAVKLAPWELVHVASFALASADGRFTTLQASLLAMAWMLMLVYLLWVWRTAGRRGPHDRLAGTTVVPVNGRAGTE